MVRPGGPRRATARALVGLFIIAVGSFALLDNLHLFDARLVQPFWPLILVALGALRLSGGDAQRGQVFGVGLVVVRSEEVV